MNFVTFNNAELWILQTVIPTCKTDKNIFCDESFNERRRKPRYSVLGLKMSPTPQTSYQVSGMQFIHKSGDIENDWEVFYYLIYIFQMQVKLENLICLNDLHLYC